MRDDLASQTEALHTGHRGLGITVLSSPAHWKSGCRRPLGRLNLLDVFPSRTSFRVIMGNWQSSSEVEHPPPEIVKLTDAVYMVHAPDKCEPDMDILLFHGLELSDSRETYWKSWMSESVEGKTFWPKEWLAPKFPRARIFLVSYDASAVMSASAGRLDLYATGECLVTDLMDVGDMGQGRPIILVAHSLGGIVMKEMILQANRKAHGGPDDGFHQRGIWNFLNQIKGLFYFSTPHYGPNLLNLATSMLTGRKVVSKLINSVSGKDVDRLNDAFRIWRKNRKDGLQAFTIAETHPTVTRKGSFGRQSSIVVPESSARYDTDGFLCVPADHFQVAKPTSPVSTSFLALTRFISAVTGIPAKTFQVDSYNMATGLPVEMPGQFDAATSRPRPNDSEPAEGIPVKSMQRDHSGQEMFVRIDVPEDRNEFTEQYEHLWQDDIVRNYRRDP